MAADSPEITEDGIQHAGPPRSGSNGSMKGNGVGMTIIETPRALVAVDEDVEGDTDGSGPAAVEAEAVDVEAVEAAAVEAVAVEAVAVEAVAVEAVAVEALAVDAEADGEPAPGGAVDTTVQTSANGHGVDPAYVVEAPVAVPANPPDAAAQAADGTLTDAAYLVEDTGPGGPPVHTAPPGSLAAAVADHLAGRVPSQGDDRVGSAQAVLDVLRASGWSDAAETDALRAEVERLRELLDMVVRDHRARVATDANGHAEQAHWLVPLLRAAHGVSFGTLGAKVHLRTAVQDVPPEMLASAGLRIDDYVPEPDRG